MFTIVNSVNRHINGQFVHLTKIYLFGQLLKKMRQIPIQTKRPPAMLTKHKWRSSELRLLGLLQPIDIQHSKLKGSFLSSTNF